jgi:transposase
MCPLGNEDGVMPKEQCLESRLRVGIALSGRLPRVRMVCALCAELGAEHGMLARVARQLGEGTESVRAWVRQADIDDGYAPGASTSEVQRIKDLERKVRELKRANEILKRAARFFGVELCATRRRLPIPLSC